MKLPARTWIGKLLPLIGALLFWNAAPAGSNSPNFTVTIHAQSSEPAAGRTTRLALRFAAKPGWHGYWSNPGDSGLPPNVSWTTPPGVSVGKLQHPAPTLLSVAGLESYVHSGTYVLLAELRVPSHLSPGTPLPIKAQLNWLACTDSLCVPQKATVEADLVVGKGREAESTSALFRAAAAALPINVKTPGHFQIQDGQVALKLPRVALNIKQAHFYPAEQDVISADRQSLQQGPDGAIITMPAPKPSPTRLDGVVSDGRRSYMVRFVQNEAAAPSLAPSAAKQSLPAITQVSSPVPPSPAVESARSSASRPSSGSDEGVIRAGFMASVAAALLGGILLNLMPCVFPILSLKALALARSSRSGSETKRDALFYVAGTTTTCLLLGAAVLGLQSSGAAIGWSFQLQSPWVVLLLLILVSGIAANLAGLFEIQGPSWAGAPAFGGSTSSFSTGALSAVIATPCSAPFMASALGAAMILPPLQGLAVFAALGLGVGLPFLLVGFFPRVRVWLPRPGAWMETFRKILALPMALTAVWLLWILGRQTGVDTMVVVVLLVAGLVALLWWIGVRQRQGRDRPALPLIPAALTAAAFAMTLPVPNSSAVEPAQVSSGAFSEERLSQLRLEGRPVFVDFTADWCLTCKVNERLAIDRPETQAAFDRAGIVTLEGDWTSGDPRITKFLAAHGRNSIPFYLFYAPGAEPEILPQLLTPAMLQKLGARVGSSRTAVSAALPGAQVSHTRHERRS